KLHQFADRGGVDAWRDETCTGEGRRLGGERNAEIALRHIHRLDAERIARKRQGVARRIVERKRIHATQAVTETRVPRVEHVHDRLAVAPRAESLVGENAAELEIIVDLAVADELAMIGAVQRLVSTSQVDDRQALVDKTDAAAYVTAFAVRAA